MDYIHEVLRNLKEFKFIIPQAPLGQMDILDGDVKAQLWVMTGKVPTRSPTKMRREPPSTGNIFQNLNNIEPIWLRNDKNHNFS